ncbi:MAG: biotin/lipoate protein ligase [Deltaproteobacteria bacterium]|jgi:lipoate-protein ligase A|nr:biotin/lipoate protein ligase [Deltaproteobacteria bacterium]
MKLYNLGKVPWQESQLIYHALAELGWEALSLVSPASPYVCIGFHQDVEQEVDLAYCNAKNIPVFRRDVGGGAVYLDGSQLFFQLILHKDHPEVPKNKEIFYRKFLQPIINVYRRIGIPAAYKPVNDVLAGTKKISGTGVGEIGDCIVFVGNLIVDFNYEEMSKVLKVPDEKFRDKIHKTLKENLTTIRRELGEKEASRWDEGTLNAFMAEEFQKILGPMAPCAKDSMLQAKMDELSAHLMSDEWFFQQGKTVPGREVKIRAGLNVIQKAHKAPGGLIRADYEVKEGRIKGVSVSGDFFCFPRTGIRKLEKRLEDQPIEQIGTLLGAFYSEDQVETPGITVQDWQQVFKP